MAIVITDNKHYEAIADKVREIKGTTETMTPSEMPSKVQSVYDTGYTKGKAEGGGGDSPLLYITTLQAVFQGAVFPENYDLLIEVNSLRVASNKNNVSTFAFQSQNLRSVKLINRGDKTLPLIADNMFRGCSTLESVDLTEFNLVFSTMTYFALTSSKLKAIYGELDISKVTEFTNWLSGCTALEEMRFKKETINISIDFFWCPNLSNDTVNSIIDGLVTITDGVARTISFHATVKSKLTDEQKATITTTKGWTLT